MTWTLLLAIAVFSISLVLWLTTHFLVLHRAPLPPGWTSFQRHSLDLLFFLVMISSMPFFIQDAVFGAWCASRTGTIALVCAGPGVIALTLFLVSRYLRRTDLVEATGFDPLDVES